MEKADEPPSCCQNLVLIGRNSRGNRVAQESHGLFGGLFVSRAQAVKYALSENGHHSATIVLSADIVELGMHRKRPSAPSSVKSRQPRSLCRSYAINRPAVSNSYAARIK